MEKRLTIELPPETMIIDRGDAIVLLHTERNARGLHLIKCVIPEMWLSSLRFAPQVLEAVNEFWLVVAVEALNEQTFSEGS